MYSEIPNYFEQFFKVLWTPKFWKFDFFFKSYIPKFRILILKIPILNFKFLNLILALTLLTLRTSFFRLRDKKKKILVPNFFGTKTWGPPL